ncbi:MAG: hypothetical protein JXA93_00515, partial [Anaerolineae bacterium]|nr:hypothetical protein [Anaerolineae bacterium]
MAIQDPWRRRLLLGVSLALVALLLTSASLAQKPEHDASFSLTGGPGPEHSFTYQGRLSSDGVPADGHYDFVVTVWDAAELGIQLATCNNVGSVDNLDNQPVERGLFTFYLVCGDWNGDVFTGGARFLEIQVRPHGEIAYTTLPRQAIAPTPYAWSLYPQAKIEGPTSGSAFGEATLNINNTASPQSSGPALYVQTASGSAVRADSGGQAVYGYTYFNHAIVGRSVQSVAGDFQSDEGYGLTVNSDGGDHWDHAGYFTSDMGYGIYVNSAGNNGLR